MYNIIRPKCGTIVTKTGDVVHDNQRSQLIVVNEHTLGCILNPETSPGTYQVLHASILRGAVFEQHPGFHHISVNDTVRLASKADFENFRVVFDGYENDPNYMYAERA